MTATVQESTIREYLEMTSRVPADNRMGWKYHNISAYVLAHGHEAVSADLTEDELLIVKQAMTHRYPERKCFQSAVKIVLRDKSKQLVYVEGYATSIIPMHHAWVELNGKVVDLTWQLDSGYVTGTIPGGMSYYGVAFSRKDVKWRSQQTCASMLNDWVDRWPLLRTGNMREECQ